MEKEKRSHRERRKSAKICSNEREPKDFTRQDWIEIMSEAYYQALKRIKAEELEKGIM